MKKIVGFLSLFLISSLAFGQVKLKEKDTEGELKEMILNRNRQLQLHLQARRR